MCLLLMVISRFTRYVCQICFITLLFTAKMTGTTKIKQGMMFDSLLWQGDIINPPGLSDTGISCGQISSLIIEYAQAYNQNAALKRTIAIRESCHFSVMCEAGLMWRMSGLVLPDKNDLAQNKPIPIAWPILLELARCVPGSR